MEIKPNYSDSQIDELMKLYGREVDPYPTEAHKHMLPLSLVAGSSYLNLNTVIRFFEKRYPRRDLLVNSYYRFFLQKIDGLDETQIALHLIHTKKKGLGHNFVTYIRKMFTA